MELPGDMVRTSSGRKGRGDTLSEASLLTPLPAAGPRETTEPPDIRHVLEAIHDLRAFIGDLPSRLQQPTWKPCGRRRRTWRRRLMRFAWTSGGMTTAMPRASGAFGRRRMRWAS